MVCHHLAIFGGRKICTSRDKMLLLCHVIKQVHVVEGSGDYNNRSPS